MLRLLLVTSLLLAAPLAGCLSGEDEDPPIQKQRADVTDQLGGIQGVVTDESIQPVVGANVTLQETGDTVQTASDGSYAFSRLPPATYTVTVRADGFVSAQDEVTVTAGEVAVFDVIVAHAQSQEPFQGIQEMAGFIECGVGWETRPNPLPGLTSNAVAICAVPQILVDNSTNDKFLVNLDLEAPIDTAVYEIQIPGDGGPAGSTILSIDMWIQGFVFEERANLFDLDAVDGSLVRMDRPAWENISANFTEACNGTNESEPDDAFCGYNFFDQGWPLTIRAFADGGCLPGVVSACAPIQQEFTHFVSAFYHAPAPEGYTLLGGS